MRTVTELYDNYYDAKAAVQALESAGVPSDHISIVSNNENGVDVEGQGSYANEGAGMGAGMGAVAGGAGGLLAGLGMLVIPGVGPVVAAGWLAATAAGAAAGAVAGGAVGGIVGAMISAGIPEDDANLYAEGLRRGGSVVTANIEDNMMAEVHSILDRSHPVDIDLRRSSYGARGWRQFDEDADPYTREQMEEDRRLREERL